MSIGFWVVPLFPFLFWGVFLLKLNSKNKGTLFMKELPEPPDVGRSVHDFETSGFRVSSQCTCTNPGFRVYCLGLQKKKEHVL